MLRASQNLMTGRLWLLLKAAIGRTFSRMQKEGCDLRYRHHSMNSPSAACSASISSRTSSKPYIDAASWFRSRGAQRRSARAAPSRDAGWGRESRSSSRRRSDWTCGVTTGPSVETSSKGKFLFFQSLNPIWAKPVSLNYPITLPNDLYVPISLIWTRRL